jgi:ricin-type beta-trefoil lectin protein
MKCFTSRLNRIPWVVAVVLAICFGTTAVPASANPPQNFFGDQLQTFIPQPAPLPGECLDVDLGTAGNVRTNVHLWHCRANNDPEQGYQLFDTISIPGRPPTEFKIRNRQTAKCLTYNVNGLSFTPVWAEQCDKNGQGWSTPDSPFRYVANETAHLCLDVQGTDGHEGSGIDLAMCSEQTFVNWITFKP